MTTLTEKRKVPLAACRLRSHELIELRLAAAETPEVEGKPRSREWSMVANIGKTMQRWWGFMVLDLAGARFRQRLPLLKDHDTEQRLGYSSKIEVTERGLEASGRLLTKSPMVEQVLADAADGFPWQASIIVEPHNVQVLDEGQSAEANGRTVEGPVHIWRDYTVRELTITALGADDETSAEAFGAGDGAEVEALFHRSEEIEMAETKTPPAKPAELSAASVRDSHPAVAAELQKLGVDGERERALAILEAADPSQQQLAVDLVKRGASREEALQVLLGDLRQRHASALRQVTAAPGTEPAGAPAPENSRKAALAAMPEGPEKWKAEWEADEALAAEFIDQASYLAWRRRNPAPVAAKKES